MRENLNNRKIVLPGWKLLVEEVSNNVYEITLTDDANRKAGTTDSDLEAGIRKCAEYAFEIEKQIRKKWNKFLFEAALIELTKEDILESNYDDDTFGSWFIEFQKERIIRDGKENILIKQLKTTTGWEDEVNFNLRELSYDDFLSAVSQKK
ncbi:hypothetical protein [uncultured Pontibacter sp.]|uniref:hypothetical protein n=1 Tax=uncultured Pontibacter sp. TaxID=453356 RepID=UPI002635B2C4|nr:hypothetical protein [uncultured Pontibacter sp.]